MHPKLNNNKRYYFLLLINLTLIPSSLCQNSREYETCRALSRCVNIQNITYPFWSDTRPSYCGYPGFQLDCQGDFPTLTISSRQYRVLQIDDDTNTLRVARQDLSNTVCPRFLYNTTLDFNLFRPSNEDRNITLYYGCSLIGQGFPIPNQFMCNVSSTTATMSFYAIGEPPVGLGTSITCSNSIYVPINQTAFATLEAPSLLQGAFASGFSLQWEANNTICEDCVDSGGLCGTSRDSNSFACYCANGTFPLTCHDSQTLDDSQTPDVVDSGRSVLKVILITGVSFIVFAIFSIILFAFARRKYMFKGNMRNYHNIELFLKNHGNLSQRRYKYSDLKKITNSFKEKLGEGGFASVYKGKLPDDRDVAVKVLKESKGNGEEFINEVASICKTSHVNVVNLLGFCVEGSKRALVYEFMPNGSLEKFIYSKSSLAKRQLGWEKLFQIAVGIARGIEYLHQGCNTRILHFDIKPHNILLDEDFNPRISDFGLAKLCPNRSSIVSLLGARGTIGYIAPELVCRNIGEVSHKSDVYSYGMMILEMVGERKNIDVEVDRTSEIYFPHWIYKHLEHNAELNLNSIANEDENLTIRKMIIVGLWCIQTDPTIRPPTTKVVEMLEGNMDSLQIPPKPYLSSPPRQEQTSSTSESTITSLS